MPTAEEILAQQSEEWKNAEASGTWYPPDGEYTVQIEDAGCEMGGDYAWVFTNAQIIDGEYEGKKFPALRSSSKAFFNVKSFVQGLGEDPDAFDSPVEAVEFLKTQVGEVVRLKKGTNKKGYPDIRVLEKM